MSSFLDKVLSNLYDYMSAEFKTLKDDEELLINTPYIIEDIEKYHTIGIVDAYGIAECIVGKDGEFTGMHVSSFVSTTNEDYFRYAGTIEGNVLTFTKLGFWRHSVPSAHQSNESYKPTKIIGIKPKLERFLHQPTNQPTNQPIIGLIRRWRYVIS